MKTLVTGATGFIGNHIVRLLLKQGRDVRVLVGPKSPLVNLEGLKIERVYGDIADRETVLAAVQGCEVVYHAASLFGFWRKDPQEFYDVNVGGTRHVIAACREHQVRRLIYTSTIAAVGYGTREHPATEASEWNLGFLGDHFTTSKRLAEMEMKAAANDGLPAVILNPSSPVGTIDSHPSPVGGAILGVLKSTLPVMMPANLNIIDVEDVARGHLLAEQKGQPGERYLLTGEAMTLVDVVRAVEQQVGRRWIPVLTVPNVLGTLVATGSHILEGELLHRRPLLPLNAIRAATLPAFYDNRKAREELGLTIGPAKAAINKAIAWYREHHFV